MKSRILILGAGPGGYVAAVRAAQLGAEVTVIVADNVGGTCLNWGCIPSKVMITTAEMLDKFRRADHFGIDLAGSVKPNMPNLMARKQRVIQDQALGILKLFKQHHIRYLKGTGYIKGPGLAAARCADGGGSGNSLGLADHCHRHPTGHDSGHSVLSSNHALNLEKVPQKILIIGGGVIGCEFACMLSASGASVTLVESLPRLLPLPSMDISCSKAMLREMKKTQDTMFVEPDGN